MFYRKIYLNSFITLSLLSSACLAQFTLHNDAFKNSFTLKAPGVQQSFTRYFGGKRTGNLVQMATQPLLQQQPQQPLEQYTQQQYQQPQLRQPLALAQPQFSRYSASAQYQQPSRSAASSAGGYPFETTYDQPVNQGASSYATAAASYQPTAYSTPPQLTSYPAQMADYRAISQAASQPVSQPLSQPPLNGLPSYADHLQQGYESYQQEQLQAQVADQHRRQQEQLLMDLYKQTPQGQGRPVTESPGRSQAFYTADQYINFLNRQHQDVFSQQQTQTDRGYQFSPMSAYTNGTPTAVTAGANGQMMQYSPSTNVSHVNYSNGKLSYNY